MSLYSIIIYGEVFPAWVIEHAYVLSEVRKLESITGVHVQLRSFYGGS